MKVFVENSLVKIRKEGLFLCLDSSNYNKLWESLYDVIKTQCKNFDIPLKIGLLNWDENIHEVPDELFILSNYIPERGRFIAPLVEGVFSELDSKDYDLLILSSEKIYDIEDWQDEIQSKFNKIFLMNPDELEKKTRVQLEKELIKLVFDFKIDKVVLTIQDSLCYDFPDGFNLKIEDEKFVLTKDFDDQLVDIDLKTSSLSEDAVVTINTCNSTVHVNISNTEHLVKPVFSKLDDDNAMIFLNSIENYKKGKSEHHCPLCKQDHGFQKAFLCNMQKNLSRFSATECIMFDDVETERKADSQYVIYNCRDNSVYYHVFKKPVLYTKNGEFIVVHDEGNISYVRISKRIEITELQEIHKGLYYYLDGDIYILTLR